MIMDKYAFTIHPAWLNTVRVRVLVTLADLKELWHMLEGKKKVTRDKILHIQVHVYIYSQANSILDLDSHVQQICLTCKSEYGPRD